MPHRPSVRHVRRLLQGMGFISRKAVFKPLLKKAHKQDRKKFAQKFSRWNVDQWSKVVFSDEKVFRLRLLKRVKCWRPKGTTGFEAKYRVPSVARVDGIMVWCAINGRGDLCLRRCPPVVDSKAYQDILESAKKFLNSRYIFAFLLE